MERQIVLTDTDAQYVARTLRSLCTHGERLLSIDQIQRACQLADQLEPLPEGEWRPWTARRAA